MGTPSGPAGPGEGAGLSVPNVLSEASLSFGLPPAGPAGLPPFLVTASVIPAITMMATSPAPIAAIQ